MQLHNATLMLYYFSFLFTVQHDVSSKLVRVFIYQSALDAQSDTPEFLCKPDSHLSYLCSTFILEEQLISYIYLHFYS